MNKDSRILLSDIPAGKSCVVVKVNGYGGFRHRVLEMGFVKGQVVTVIKNAPLQDPIEYKILNSYISLRRSEASQVEVVDIGESIFYEDSTYYGTLTEETRKQINDKQKTINVALVGNPNCGKTSFFNYATGLKEKVGNYAGVTVSAKVGVFKERGYTINLVDLPGTYSITEYTPEEMYVRQYLLEENPDLVLNIIDTSNLERNLFLTTQLIDMNVKMVGALNMFDEFESSGNSLDYNYLGSMLGFPFVPTTAKDGKGIADVIDAIINVYEDRDHTRKHIHINYGATIENAIEVVKNEVMMDKGMTDRYSSRYLSIKLLEGDKPTLELFYGSPVRDKVLELSDTQRQRIVNDYKDDSETVITNLKYGFIRGALKETFKKSSTHKYNFSEKLDNVLTNRWLGIPILLFFMWVMFQATFQLGVYPQGWIESGVELLSAKLLEVLPTGIFTDFLIDGVIAGVGGVIVFLPNILILFFFISLMEDTGYMARATFILDKLMHLIGLHGRSFIPLLTGFGCSVPAIMATRTLENKKDRILTMLIIPFMSCSAKLPVYILLVSAFFDENQGLVLLGIYLFGVIIAILSALLLKNTIFKKASEQFVLELPPYRTPTLKNTASHVWTKSAEYLKKMGTVILAASVLIWVLGYFPRYPENVMKEGSTAVVEGVVKLDANDGSDADSDVDGFESGEVFEVGDVPDFVALQKENSYIGRIGKFIEPVLAPLGFDWKMSISLLTGFAAKETIVSTMEILKPEFSQKVAYSFIIFILLYTPCVATVIACAKESSRKWALFMVLYTFAVAWIVAFIVFRVF